jgi:hypothetical protein
VTLGTLRPGLGSGDWRRWASGGAHSGTGAFCLTWLTALGIVLELFIEEKYLLSGGENKLAVAVNAGQKSI